MDGLMSFDKAPRSSAKASGIAIQRNGEFRYYAKPTANPERIPPDEVDCPDCPAEMGERCQEDGKMIRRFHPGRTQAAKMAA